MNRVLEPDILSQIEPWDERKTPYQIAKNLCRKFPGVMEDWANVRSRFDPDPERLEQLESAICAELGIPDR